MGAVGTVASVAADKFPGPMFVDTVTIVGPASYSGSGGSTGLLAKLQALRLDQRAIVAAIPADNGLYTVTYNPATDKLKVEVDDAVTGVMAEVADTTSLSGVTFTLYLFSK